MVSGPSQSRTMGQPPSLPPSSSSSSSHSPTAGAIETRPDPQMKTCDLPEHQKAPPDERPAAARIDVEDPKREASSRSFQAHLRPHLLNDAVPVQMQLSELVPDLLRLIVTSLKGLILPKTTQHTVQVSLRPNCELLRGIREAETSQRTPSAPSVTGRLRWPGVATVDNVYGLRTPHYTPSFVNGVDAAPFAMDAGLGTQAARQLSWGGFWTVGGRGATQLGQLHAVQAGSSSMLASGTNAPMHTPTFLDTPTKDDMIRAHEGRLALAMDIDQASKVLHYASPTTQEAQSPMISPAGTRWRDNTWTRDKIPKCMHPLRAATLTMKLRRTDPSQATPKKGQDEKRIPTVAFRVLDAPHLKDDYYCSILAYCYTSRTLAVALTHKVYLWTEEYGVRYPPLPQARTSNFVTSLAFSSEEGRQVYPWLLRGTAVV